MINVWMTLTDKKPVMAGHVVAVNSPAHRDAVAKILGPAEGGQVSCWVLRAESGPVNVAIAVDAEQLLMRISEGR